MKNEWQKKNPYQQYRQTQVNTMSQGELTLLLYQGAVRFTKQSLNQINNKNQEEAHQSIIRVQDIITELIVTLNMDYDISHQLMPVYDYLKRRLIEANIRKDISILTEVLGFLEEFVEVWTQVIDINKKKALEKVNTL